MTTLYFLGVTAPGPGGGGTFTGPNSTTWTTSESPRAGDGVVTRSVDQNGRVTTSAYDALSRPTQVTVSGTIMSKFAYPVMGQAQVVSKAPYVAESSIVNGSDYTTSYSYFNGSGQQVTTQTDAPDASGDKSGLSSGQVATGTYYNALGLASSVVPAQNVAKEPADGIAVPTVATSQPVTQNSYDAIGRITSAATVPS